jgi:ubiquitin C-terminal hydrolase
MGKKKHVTRVSRRAVTKGGFTSEAATSGSDTVSNNTRSKVNALRKHDNQSCAASTGDVGTAADTELTCNADGVMIDLQKVPLGLQNIGNTCFFNSVVQSFFTMHMSLDLGIYRNHSLPLSCAVADSFHQLHMLRRGNFKPSSIFDVLTNFFPQFKGRRQQDAHELYICLLSRLDDELRIDRRHRMQAGERQQCYEKESCFKSHDAGVSVDEADSKCTVLDSEISEINDARGFTWHLLSPFEGRISSVVTCGECGRRSATLDVLYDFSLEVPGTEHLMKLPQPKRSVVCLGSKNKRKAVEHVKEAISSPSTLAGRVRPPSPEAPREPNDSSEGEVSEALKALSLDTPADSTTRSDFLDCSSNGDTTAEGSKQLMHCRPELPSPQLSPAHILADEIVEPPVPDDKASSGDDPTLLDCLNSFTSVENLSVHNGNGFDCVFCRHRQSSINEHRNQISCERRVVSASRRLTLFRRPKFLTLHLKRLLPGGKYSGFVQFPLLLDMGPFISRSASPVTVPCANSSAGAPLEARNDFTCNEATEVPVELLTSAEQCTTPQLRISSSGLEEDSNFEEDPDVVDLSADGKTETEPSIRQVRSGIQDNTYLLRAVVVHQGGAWGGHYIAYVRRGSDWFYCSDTSVRRAETSEVLRCQAYMLFYHAAVWEE